MINQEQELRRRLEAIHTIQTLVERVPNRIVRVNDESVVVRSVAYRHHTSRRPRLRNFETVTCQTSSLDSDSQRCLQKINRGSGQGAPA